MSLRQQGKCKKTERGTEQVKVYHVSIYAIPFLKFHNWAYPTSAIRVTVGRLDNRVAFVIPEWLSDHNNLTIQRGADGANYRVSVGVPSPLLDALALLS